MNLLEHFLDYVPRKHRGRGISLVVPFRADTPDRAFIWQYLREYYEYHLPKAELIVGTDHGVPFSKTAAWNDGMQYVTGDVVVLLDADCYIDTRTIELAAFRIREARKAGRRAWTVPYRSMQRLTAVGTMNMFKRPPQYPHVCFTASSCEPESGGYDGENVMAHHYGALIMIIPIEAWMELGGFDPRFRSWGAEDISTSMALDTLYCKHRTMAGTVVTPHHQVIGSKHHRVWSGGERDANGQLGMRYRRAWGDPVRMRALVDEYTHLVYAQDEDLTRWDDEGGYVDGE